MCVIADESIFNQAIHHTGILTGRLLKSERSHSLPQWVRPDLISGPE